MQIRTGRLSASLFLLFAGLILPSGASPAAQAPKPRFVVVLLDETSSFTPYWQPSIDFAARVAMGLRPGDAFAVIGIDNHGMDPEDARIPITLIDPGTLKSIGDKKALARKVKLLTRRPATKPFRTDILNATRQAAVFSQSNAVQGFEPMLVYFSDMQETPRLPVPGDIKGWSFPQGGTAHCFFVNVTGWADRVVTSHAGAKASPAGSWNSMTDQWISVFTKLGLKADAQSFHQSGQAAVEIRRLFPVI